MKKKHLRFVTGTFMNEMRIVRTIFFYLCVAVTVLLLLHVFANSVSASDIVQDWSGDSVNNAQDTNAQAFRNNASSYRRIAFGFSLPNDTLVDGFDLGVARITNFCSACTLTIQLYEGVAGTLLTSANFSFSIVPYLTFDDRGTYFDSGSNFITFALPETALTANTQYYVVYLVNGTVTSANAHNLAINPSTNYVQDGDIYRITSSGWSEVTGGLYPLMRVRGVESGDSLTPLLAQNPSLMYNFSMIATTTCGITATQTVCEYAYLADPLASDTAFLTAMGFLVLMCGIVCWHIVTKKIQ